MKANLFEEFRKFDLDKPLVMTIAGGGYSLLDILKYPGASKKVEQIFCPYGEYSLSLWDTISKKYVSIERSKSYAKNIVKISSLPAKTVSEYTYVGITASLRTNRKRHGAEHAYITFWLSASSVLGKKILGELYAKRISNALIINSQASILKITFEITFHDIEFSDDDLINEEIRLKQDVDIANFVYSIIMYGDWPKDENSDNYTACLVDISK